MDNRMMAPLFIISGASGTGKTTMLLALLNEFKQLKRVVTYTTRLPRENERNGVDYWFITEQAFHAMNHNNQFIETNRYNNYWYGMPKALMMWLDSNQAAIAIPDINGTQALLVEIPQAITIWLTIPPTLLKQRLIYRNTENAQTIEKRLFIGIEEEKKAKKLGIYKHTIDCSDFNVAYKQIKTIITDALS